MGFVQKREEKFRDYDFETKTIRYFNLDTYDRNEHDCYGNITKFAFQKDIKGVDIYEGDILSERWKCTVYVDNQTGAFMVKFGVNPEKNKPITLYQYLKNRKLAGTEEVDCAIFSNIYIIDRVE